MRTTTRMWSRKPRAPQAGGAPCRTAASMRGVAWGGRDEGPGCSSGLTLEKGGCPMAGYHTKKTRASVFPYPCFGEISTTTPCPRPPRLSMLRQGEGEVNLAHQQLSSSTLLSSWTCLTALKRLKTTLRCAILSEGPGANSSAHGPPLQLQLSSRSTLFQTIVLQS